MQIEVVILLIDGVFGDHQFLLVSINFLFLHVKWFSERTCDWLSYFIYSLQLFLTKEDVMLCIKFQGRSYVMYQVPYLMELC